MPSEGMDELCAGPPGWRRATLRWDLRGSLLRVGWQPVDPGRQKSDVARQIVSVRAEPAAAVGEIAPPAPVSAVLLGDMDTAHLVDAVIQGGYSGPAWEELARRLVRRALPDLEQAIRSGAIYRRCARAGVAVQRRSVLQSGSYPEDIAAEAVEDCLLRFQARVLPEGQWDPKRGASLEDYFCACCLPDLANRWRWHLRHLSEFVLGLDSEGPATIVPLAIDPAPGPADVAEQTATAAEALTTMAEQDRVAFVLLTAGWRPEEIARTLGMGRNTLDARISRARKAARARRTS